VNKITVLIVALASALFSGLLLGRTDKSAVSAESIASRDSGTNEEAIEMQIVSKEHEELDSLKTGNLKLFDSLLADDAVFVDSQGPAGKAQVVKNVAEFKLLEYSMEDVSFVSISTKSGLITYKMKEKGISHGKEFAALVYISAVWTERGRKWVCVFSQETAAK
jgi:hypothetical protein